MNTTKGLRFLRPRLHNDLSPARRAAYLRFFSVSTPLYVKEKYPRKIMSLNKYKQPIIAGVPFRGEVQERIEELRVSNALEWPRIESNRDAIRVEDFLEKYRALKRGELREQEWTLVRGRLRSFRIAGSSLVFLDLAQDGRSVQVVLNRARLESFGGVHRSRFKEFYHLIRRGDIMCEFCLRRCCSCANIRSCVWESLFFP